LEAESEAALKPSTSEAPGAAIRKVNQPKPISARTKDSSSRILELNLPCFQPLTVFLPRLGFASMLLLNRVRKYALVAIFRIHFLARKRCFSGGTDTSGGVETLRQSPGLLTDGGRRKKRDVDFTIPKHIGIRARVEYGFQRINHRIGERGAIQRRQP
jgi:hypothetical protein